jgi:hypothetical protein
VKKKGQRHRAEHKNQRSKLKKQNDRSKCKMNPQIAQISQKIIFFVRSRRTQIKTFLGEEKETANERE